MTAAAAPRPRRAAPAWRTRARGAIPYLVVAASGFVLGYLAIFLFVFPTALVPNDRPVPNVVGLMDSDAQRTLRDAGFVVCIGEQRTDQSVPPGTVVRQTPPATTQKPKGTEVVLDVAAP